MCVFFVLYDGKLSVSEFWTNKIFEEGFSELIPLFSDNSKTELLKKYIK